ncbi:SDR family NAD(P)-dependent oxidoreductase [Neptunicoccus cionae]|uniref:Oxidoreductase n=1 Tax=Neptunicoccus cionae TaxID=2035344 RepID=A0A916QYY7_9RHOB|nr:SDR family NAD(P)-dependent oxidoreductase [Amylibacter cionae]GGA21604.1 oxidoreductase [Amylibacter cionae]
MTQPISLVTGASRGLGAATAEALAAKGHHVIALARTTGALEELDDRIQAKGGTTTLVPLDVKDEEAVKRLCISIYERWGGLDLWVHCINHAPPLSPANHAAQKDWDNTFNTNVRMAQQLIVNIDPLLEARKGTAVHCHDPRAGEKFFAAYGASKAAQKALFDSWAAEGAGRGRKVVSFEPAPMPTATRARFYPGEDRGALTSCATEAARLVALL